MQAAPVLAGHWLGLERLVVELGPLADAGGGCVALEVAAGGRGGGGGEVRLRQAGERVPQVRQVDGSAGVVVGEFSQAPRDRLALAVLLAAGEDDGERAIRERVDVGGGPGGFQELVGLLEVVESGGLDALG